MSILHFTGFEQGNVRSGEGSDDYQPPAGSVSIQTTVKKNGAYSAEFDKVSTATCYLAFPLNFTSEGKVDVNTANKGTVYFTGYFRYATKPSSGDEIILTVQGSNSVAELRLKSDGALVLYDTNYTGSPSLLATSGTTLSADTWYRIGLKIVAGSSGSYELKINGASQFSASRTWLNTENLGKIQIGCGVDRNSQSFKFYWDDIVGDTANYIDVDYAVKVIKPIANGSVMTWSDGTGASDYTQIDEIPIDDADYIMSPTSGNPNTALFDYESRATAGIENGTIYAIKQVIICRENSSSGTTQTYMRLISGATTTDTPQNNFTTSTQGLIKVHETDPNTGSAWTGSALDSIEAGVRENNGKQTRCISSLIYVLYEVNTTVTTTKTVTGVARIQKAVTQTINGLSRITAATLRTITGKANIRATTLQTVTGKGRIQKSASQTISGLSRIQKAVSQTIAGLSRITKSVTATITGLSRITASTLRTISGTAKITATTTRTIDGKARIQITTTRTIQGLSRITKSVAQTVSGLARITIVTSQTIDGKARITATTLRTIQGVANIRNSTLQTIQGKGRIQKSVTQTIQGISRIVLTALQTINGVAKITATTLRTVTGLARITATTLRTITGKGRIQTSVQQTTTGKSRVTVSVQRTKTGVSRIQIVTSRTIDGLARITATVGRTATGKARIQATTTRTIDGKARLEVSNQADIEGTAKVVGTRTQNITGVACIVPINYMRKGEVILSNKENLTILQTRKINNNVLL